MSTSQSKKLKNTKAFTLVELIIVITILAILATIAFMSFQGYTKNARDSNRTATLTNLQKGLDIYSVQVGNFPEPDGTILSGTLNGVQLTRVGVIGDNISRLVKMNKTPTDPIGGNNYAYGISADNKYYQIGVTLENPESYNMITKTTYADNGSYRAKVVGNYKYPLKYNGKLYSLPSLLFTGTGGDLSQTGNAYFVINNGQNIPYTPDKSTLNNTQDTTQVLQSITGTGNLVLTGITLPTETSEQFKALTSTSSTLQNLEQALGITDQTQLGNVIYGSSYNTNTSVNATSGGSTPSNSCTTTPSGVGVATTVAGTPTSPNQAWQSTNAGNPCYYTCNANYGGTNCSTFTPPPAYVSGTPYTKGQSFTFDFITWYVSANTKVAYTKQTPELKDIPQDLTSSDLILVFENGSTLTKGTNAFILKTVNEGATTPYIYGTTTYPSGKLWGAEPTISTYGANTTERKAIYTADKSMLGDYYQWGRNDPVSLLNTGSTLYSATGYQTGGINISGSGFILGPTTIPYSWMNSTQHNATSSVIWTDSNNPGPCSSGTGYRLPTTSVGGGEWRKVVEIVTGKDGTTGQTWSTPERQTLQQYLLLPMAGSRSGSSGDFNLQGSGGFYWSSSVNGVLGHDLYFNSTSIYPSSYDSRANGFVVRCFRN